MSGELVAGGATFSSLTFTINMRLSYVLRYTGPPVILTNSTSRVPMNNFVLQFFGISFLLLTSISIIGAQAAEMSSLPTPPVARKVPKSTEIHGEKLVDNYYWLRDKPNPEVKTYVEAENAYADAVMKASEPLQKQLYDEMLGRMKETDTDVPYQEGDYLYYT